MSLLNRLSATSFMPFAWVRIDHRAPALRMVGGLAAALMLLPLFVGTSAQAQSAQATAATTTGMEIVVVSARKRLEDVQNVPISMSTVSADEITAHGAHDLRDLDHIVPNMVQAGLDSDINPSVSIRGISSDSRNIGFESGVSVYIDGVYTGRPTSYMQDLVDVDHIEVLRGPQGTLFGKNTIAGVINIVNRKPDETLRGTASFEAGNFNLFREQASVSGPISGDDTWMAGISAYRLDRNGIEDDVFNGKDYWNEHRMGGRGQLRFHPNDRLDVTLEVDGLNDRSRPETSHVIEGFGASFVASDPFDIDIDAPVRVKRDIWGSSLNGDYTLANGGTITSITAYRDNQVDFISDDDATHFAILTSHFVDHEKQFTQEVRYSSQADRRFRYVIGAYYYHQHVDTNRVSLAPAGGLAPVDLSVSIVASVVTRDWAGFAQADWDVTPSFTLTGGVRYTTERKSLDFNLVGLPPFGIISLVTQESKTSDAWTPMASAVYKINESLNAYVTVSRGFKAGGYNADFVGNDELSFGPEFVTNYEGGLKFFGAGDRLRLNLAVFHMDYSDLQVSIFKPFTGFIIGNAASATINGAELDGALQVGSHTLITTGVGYLDATFDKFITGSGDDFSGNQLPYAPRWTFNLGASQEIVLGDWGSLVVRGEYVYRASYFANSNNAVDKRIPGYSLWNGSLLFEPTNSRWNVEAWVQNLGDNLYISDQDAPIGGLLGSRSVTYGAPRTYGVRLTARL